MGARAAWVRRAPVPPSEAGGAGAGAERTAPHTSCSQALYAGFSGTQGPGCSCPPGAPHSPSPCPSPSQSSGASGGCSRAPLATGAGKTLASLSGSRHLGLC